VREGVCLLEEKGVIGTEGHRRWWKGYASASDDYETGVMGVGTHKS